MKKILAVLLTLSMLLALCACGGGNGGSGDAAPAGDVNDLLAKVTDGAVDPEMALMTPEVNADNFAWYFFIDPIEGAEAAVSEPMMNAIAHFVGLLRVPSDTDAAAVAGEIEKNMDIHKWICVEPEKTAVVVRGDLILVAMSTEQAVNTVVDNFKAL